MNEHTISKEHMDALKALTDLNLKVSEARAELSEIENTKTEYIVEREKEAVERIEASLNASKDILRETRENYGLVSDFCNTMTGFADFLKEAHARFDEAVASFDESKVIFEAEMSRQENEIAETKKIIATERVKIANDKKSIENSKKTLEKTARKLEDERGTLERAIKRLKLGRI